MQTKDIFKKSMFAGIFIGIAGFSYLANPYAGVFLFCIGLFGVIYYQLPLFTGTAGFLKSGKELEDLFLILAGNLVGTVLVALCAVASPLDLKETADMIMHYRYDAGIPGVFVLSIFCGVLMSFAVDSASSKNRCTNSGKEYTSGITRWLPLLFGIPVFITCGFPHCIADNFYIWYWGFVSDPQTDYLYFIYFLLLNLFTITGNFIGCNLYKILS